MRIVAHAASLVSLIATVAVVLALRSSGADGRRDLRMFRADERQEAVVDGQGRLHVPSDYRAGYEFLGAWAIAADKEVGSRDLHIVYATPGTIAAYQKDRHFPEGTVLIKEVYEASTGAMTTGTVSHAQTLKGWFVMVKDSKKSYPGNMLWGDGWGWSWFDAGNPQKTTSTNYRQDCLTCHVPARETDWVYTSGYPTLK
jgi:hypothetical protein